MEYHSTLISSLLLCGLVATYIFLQYRAKQQQQADNKWNSSIQPGLKIAASLQPSPGVKVHLLRWKSSDEVGYGEFLLITTAQSAQITPCLTQSASLAQSALQTPTSIKPNEISSIRSSAAHH